MFYAMFRDVTLRNIAPDIVGAKDIAVEVRQHSFQKKFKYA